MRKSRRRGKRSFRATVSIIVDGETEKWYLEMMRDYERYATLRVKPELQTVSIDRQFELLCENAKTTDVVIWLLDADTLNKELREDRSGKLLNKWTSYLNKVKKIENAHILFNTPCLEYWFLLHVKNTNQVFNQCTPLLNVLSNYAILENYEKTEKYFKNPRLNIYQRLKPNLKTAQQRAAQLGRFSLQNPMNAKAEMYKVFELLHDKKYTHGHINANTQNR